ncbi:MAG: hypothetical protein K9G48_03710 [Reyranella sp.]|nr:hypothetical protein [Reyranella sp.]
MRTSDELTEKNGVRANFDNLIAIGSFGVACAIGLVGAFVGLRHSSFWLDELFTAWIVEHSIKFDEFVARFVTDVHPPVYYVLTFLYSFVFGDDELGLRSFSAACGVAAVMLFVIATKPYFSLAGRLFGGAMATGSFFWFYHAQNARGYSLSLLIGVGILVISLSILAKRKQPDARTGGAVAGLAVLMLAGSFVHFYLMYECLAVLIVLAFFCPRQRILFMVLAGGLLVTTGLYVKLVIEVFSQYSTTTNWINGDLLWYAQQLHTAVNFSFTKKALLGLAVCAGVIAMQRFAILGESWPGREVRDSESAARPAPFAGVLVVGRFPLDAQTALFVGVPLIILAGGVSSSFLLAPNFTDRNLLVCSPFLWALSTKLYESGVPGARQPVRVVANLALSAIVLWMGVTMTAGRARQWNEPFREAADWIKTFPTCEGRPIPVINAQPRAWFKPGYSEILYADFYATYLDNFAYPQVVFKEDVLGHKIPDNMREYLEWRLDGNGCPILAWSIHLITGEEFEAVAKALLKAVGRPATDFVVQTKIVRDGLPGYVLHVEGQRTGEHSQSRDPRAPPSQRRTGPAPTPTRPSSIRK